MVEDLHPPEALADAQKASARIRRAIDENELVLVHGDYDVDGISGAALLTEWIRRLGGKAEAFVPHRLRDGYDLSASGVQRAVELGASLLITVDCGIVAHEWVEKATHQGVDVIVTDHHRPGATLPPAHAVVNPNRPDCAYPNKGLAGAGVAFKLCQLIGQERGLDPDSLWPLLDLVALATIADQVPLTGENRILVRYGLKALTQTERVGLQALVEVAGLAGRPLHSTSVAFVLAPRINAAGRIGETQWALDLFLTEDRQQAKELAERLETHNRERREIDRKTQAEAMAYLEESYDPDRDRGVVIAGEGWHPGVIGIVASRVVERVFRPAVLISLNGARGRGSARSIPGFHLYEAIAECKEHLERFGGHQAAAGMDIHRDALGAFQEAFQEASARRLADSDLQPVLNADMELRLDEVTPDFFKYLRYVGPFGQKNPEPVFVARGVHLDGPAKTAGRGHLKFRMAQGGRTLEAIGFGLAEHVPPESLGTGAVDVAFTLDENHFRGRRSLQARVRDVCASS